MLSVAELIAAMYVVLVYVSITTMLRVSCVACSAITATGPWGSFKSDLIYLKEH